MAETPTPPIFLWIKDNWEWLSVITALIATAAISWIRHFVLNRIVAITNTQERIIRVIPVDALEKGKLLQTAECCYDMRSNCQNHIVSQELLETMTIMKQAMALVINHNAEIPKDQKDKILQELVK